MPTQPRAARRRLNDSSQPESQASQAGTKRPAARSPARKPRTCDLSSAAAGGSGLTAGKSVPLRIVRHLRPASAPAAVARRPHLVGELLSEKLPLVRNLLISL